MERLYRAYGQQADFLLVYIREAHPSDGWQVPANERDGVKYEAPKTLADRAVVASECVRSMKLGFPCALDDLDNTVQRLYGAWPARACVLGPDGLFIYASPAGPQGVRPDEIENALKRALNK